MKTHIWDLLPILLCSAVILGFGLAMWLLPPSDFSESENRALATWQPPTAASLVDGSFTEQLSAFYTDQFPLRPLFTALKAGSERALGKMENNGIVFGRDGYLIARPTGEGNELLLQNLNACKTFRQRCAEEGLALTLLAVPQGADVLTARYPALYSHEDTLLSLSGSGYPDAVSPLTVLRAADGQGKYVWYRTDHHWTTYGAYLAYTVLAEKLGIAPYPLDFFTPQTVSASFFGTSHSKAGGIGGKGDAVTLYRYEGDEAVTVTNGETGEVSLGFYRREALNGKDHYRIFLGGNYSHLTVTLPSSESKPRLLLIKDSFANALIPFLSLHFDLDIIDPRYEKDSLSLEGYDHVLIVQGLDTLATDTALGRFLNP